jgi:hypothetical protein
MKPGTRRAASTGSDTMLGFRAKRVSRHAARDARGGVGAGLGLAEAKVVAWAGPGEAGIS